MAPKAEWLDDGFLHPSNTLEREFVDVDDFVRVPVDGLTELVPFARLRVDGEEYIILGPARIRLDPRVEAAMCSRYGLVDCVVIGSAKPGQVTIVGDDLTETRAAAVAVMQYRCAWDESTEIEVRNERIRYWVRVSYASDQYELSLRK